MNKLVVNVFKAKFFTCLSESDSNLARFFSVNALKRFMVIKKLIRLTLKCMDDFLKQK